MPTGETAAPRSINACLISPSAVEHGARGDVWIADAGAHRIRRVDAETGIIVIVADNGLAGCTGDGGPARQARIGTRVPAFRRRRQPVLRGQRLLRLAPCRRRLGPDRDRPRLRHRGLLKPTGRRRGRPASAVRGVWRSAATGHDLTSRIRRTSGCAPPGPVASCTRRRLGRRGRCRGRGTGYPGPTQPPLRAAPLRGGTAAHLRPLEQQAAPSVWVGIASYPSSSG